MINDAAAIKAMANKLVTERIDLGDERAVMRALTVPLADASRFKHTARDVMSLYDSAIEAARVIVAEGAQPQ